MGENEPCPHESEGRAHEEGADGLKPLERPHRQLPARPRNDPKRAGNTCRNQVIEIGVSDRQRRNGNVLAEPVRQQRIGHQKRPGDDRHPAAEEPEAVLEELASFFGAAGRRSQHDRHSASRR
jgi:hypothetical protein